MRTASLLHSDGDAMDIAIVDRRIAGVRGRAVDRVNRGRPEPKDLFGRQANCSPDRLTRPLVRQGGPGGELVETDWATAMDRVVSRSRELLDGNTRLCTSTAARGAHPAWCPCAGGSG